MNHFFRSSSLYFLLAVVFGCTMTKTRAQDAALGVLSGGREDANRLVGAYVGPLGRGFSQALGQNWFNTANSLKLLRFNVQAGATMLTLPETDRTFDANALGLQNIRPLGGQADRVPTIAGDRNAASPSWVVFGTLADSTAPGGLRSVALDTLPDLLKGLGMRNVFAPYIQANIGLIKNTELNIRYAPVLDLSTVGGNLVPDNLLRGEIRFWGAGIKHELLQWIPVLKRFPLSMSVYANHSRMSYALDTRVDGPSASDYPRTLPGNVVFRGLSDQWFRGFFKATAVYGREGNGPRPYSLQKNPNGHRFCKLGHAGIHLSLGGRRKLPDTQRFDPGSKQSFAVHRGMDLAGQTLGHRNQKRSHIAYGGWREGQNLDDCRACRGIHLG